MRLAGIEKSGAFVEHAAAIQDRLPPGSYFPEPWRVLECIRKQLTLWHLLGMKQRNWGTFAPPRLWLFCSGYPRMEDLMLLLPNTPERLRVTPILARMRIGLMQDPSSWDEEERNFIMEVNQQLVDEYLAKIHTEGREEGKQEGKQEVARNLLAEGIPFEKVAQLTGLTVQELQQLSH